MLLKNIWGKRHIRNIFQKLTVMFSKDIFFFGKDLKIFFSSQIYGWKTVKIHILPKWRFIVMDAFMLWMFKKVKNEIPKGNVLLHFYLWRLLVILTVTTYIFYHGKKHWLTVDGQTGFEIRWKLDSDLECNQFLS